MFIVRTKMKTKVKACVRSGTCCRIGPCGYGQWDEINSKCKFLVENQGGLHECGIYEQIIQDPASVDSPAFGFGCCSNIGNVARNQIIAKRFNGKEQLIEIEMTF